MSRSSLRTPKTLRIKVSPSRWLLAYLLFLLFSVALGASLLPLYLYGAIFLNLCLLLFSRHLYCRYYAQTYKHSVKEIILQANECTLGFGDGRSVQCELADGQYVSNFLVVLHLKIAGKRLGIWLPLFSDAVDSDLFRRLRVKLHFPDECLQHN